METKKRQREEPSPPSRNVRSVFPGAPVESIPDEILYHIFLFVDPIFDAFAITETCRRWYNCFYDVTLNPSNWKERKAKRNEKGLHTRFVDAFLEHHLRRHHTSVLRHYVGNRHISMANPHNRVNIKRAMEEGPVDLIKWLHCNKSVELRRECLWAWMKAARTEALDWVLDTKEPFVVYTLHVMRGTELRVFKNVRKWLRREALEEATRTHNSALWKWVWERAKATGNVSHRIIIRAAMHGFAAAFRDIIEYDCGLVVSCGAERVKDILVCAAGGGSEEILDLLAETCAKNEKPLETYPDAIREAARNALDIGNDRGYVWLDRRFPSISRSVITVAKVEVVMRRDPKASIPFVSYILGRYPELVKQLTDRAAETYLFNDPYSLKDPLANGAEVELLRALNEKGCVLYSRKDLSVLVRSHDRVKMSEEERERADEFCRLVGATLGLANPDSWSEKTRHNASGGGCKE